MRASSLVDEFAATLSSSLTLSDRRNKSAPHNRGPKGKIPRRSFLFFFSQQKHKKENKINIVESIKKIFGISFEKFFAHVSHFHWIFSLCGSNEWSAHSVNQFARIPFKSSAKPRAPSSFHGFVYWKMWNEHTRTSFMKRLESWFHHTDDYHGSPTLVTTEQTIFQFRVLFNMTVSLNRIEHLFAHRKIFGKKFWVSLKVNLWQVKG